MDWCSERLHDRGSEARDLRQTNQRRAYAASSCAVQVTVGDFTPTSANISDRDGSRRRTVGLSTVLLLHIHGHEVKPVLKERVPSQICILLAEKDADGFVMVDSQGRISKISPPRGSSASLLPEKKVPEQKALKSNLDNVFGKEKKQKAIAAAEDVDRAQAASLVCHSSPNGD